MPPDVVAGTFTPESALSDLQEVLTKLLATVDEQFAAVVEDDVERLGRLVQEQEALSARLAQVEQRRLAILPSQVFVRSSRGEGEQLSAIGRAIEDLRDRSARNTALLERKARLASQTLQYLQALVMEHSRLYGAQCAPAAVPMRSMLLDSSA
jgi:flagellar biosynthesis/type III secretory pathway chaperone